MQARHDGCVSFIYTSLLEFEVRSFAKSGTLVAVTQSTVQFTPLLFWFTNQPAQILRVPHN